VLLSSSWTGISPSAANSDDCNTMSAERIPFICKFWILSNSEKSELTYFGHFEGPLYAREVAVDSLFAAL
jgi:hypothetical protein